MARTDRTRTVRVRGVRGARAAGGQIPAGRAWLVRELGWEAAGYGCQLEALLAEPAMAAVVAGMPAVGQVLRPICRMLGVVAPALAPKEKPLDITPLNDAENEDGDKDAGKNQHPGPPLHSQQSYLRYRVQGACLAGVEGAAPLAFRPREGPPAVR